MSATTTDVIISRRAQGFLAMAAGLRAEAVKQRNIGGPAAKARAADMDRRADIYEQEAREL